MKGKRFSVEQITGALKEYDAGVPAAELCRRLGIASNTLYRWKAKYGGLEASRQTSRPLHRGTRPYAR